MSRGPILLVAETTGYQAESFRAAATRLGLRLQLATDRCHQLDDPWRDQALAVRFDQPQAAIAAARGAGGSSFAGLVAVGDRAAALAAHLAADLGLRFHPAAAAARCRDKFAFRQAIAAAGLPAPRFEAVPLSAGADALAQAAGRVGYPCVLKPLELSASRGVIRADTQPELLAARVRLARLLASPEIRGVAAETVLLESYLPGAEFALEGWMEAGRLQTLAVFDKPDPLEGPFFEETIYVAPSRQPDARQLAMSHAVESAAGALGLGPGPIHAELRWTGRGPVVLEVAARPIGGLCARALRFQGAEGGGSISLEELLLRGALGEPLERWRREERAAAVLMIPIPRSGILREVSGVATAEAVPDIEAVAITAKPNQMLQALPDGATYLGFIFARAATPAAAEAALRSAHACLEIKLDAPLPVL